VRWRDDRAFGAVRKGAIMNSLETNVLLSDRTSFCIGGRASTLYRPARAGDAVKILDSMFSRGVRPRILGGGTNLLVDDEGVRGPVISTEGLRGIRRLSGDRIHAEAGCPLGTLVSRAASFGLSGIEGLAGIPGTVGGAAVMNAGGRGASMGDRIEYIEAARPGQGLALIPSDRIRFGYRRSGLQGCLVLGVCLRLRRDRPDAIRARVREAIARKRKTQPLGMRSAGCFFRNVGSIPAGLLIDRAGLKGFRIGSAMISPVHANFIVNVGTASSRDVLRLAGFVRDTVYEIYGIRLRTEVKYWKSASERVGGKNGARTMGTGRRRTQRSARRRPIAAQLGGGS